MNVYDYANDLAKALKESKEYKQFQEAEKKLKAEPEHRKMAKDFMDKQMALQFKQMSGQEITDEELQAFSALQQAVMGIPSINDYFQTQMYLGTILQDISKTISDAVAMDETIFDEEPSEEIAETEETVEEEPADTGKEETEE